MHLSSQSVDEFIAGLAPIDRHFGSLLEKLAGAPNPLLRLTAALVSHFTIEHGHVCVSLTDASKYFADPEQQFKFPENGEWLAALRQTNVAGTPGEFRPLIIDDAGHVYLHRYWTYEQKLAEQIRSRLLPADFDGARLRDGLDRLFGRSNSGPNWQRVAAAMAVARRFSVISGGPGTGKTTTVLKILALLTEQAFPQKLRIALSAPTGKAAMRLQESIAAGKAGLDCAAAIKALIPESATTLHRLLGSHPLTSNFQFDAKHLLPVDVLVIDEASMVDLALMYKTFAAMPTASRIILLGDKNQLTSVEVGSVLREISADTENAFSTEFVQWYKGLTGEILPPATSPTLLSDHVIELRENFRFAASKEICDLTDRINRGDTAGVFQLLNNHSNSVSWLPLPQGTAFDAELSKLVLEHWSEYFHSDDPEKALDLFNRFRILTPLRHNSVGVNKLNQRVENILAKAGLIRTNATWYRRRPLMVVQNDYDAKLFNGDIGIVEQKEGTRELSVLFRRQQGDSLQLTPARVPQHDTAYAMTVHKSQGSEFDNVLLILPPNGSESILNRELLYTALSRARSKVIVWGNPDVLQAAVSLQGHRASRLGDLLKLS